MEWTIPPACIRTYIHTRYILVRTFICMFLSPCGCVAFSMVGNVLFYVRTENQSRVCPDYYSWLSYRHNVAACTQIHIRYGWSRTQPESIKPRKMCWIWCDLASAMWIRPYVDTSSQTHAWRQLGSVCMLLPTRDLTGPALFNLFALLSSGLVLTANALLFSGSEKIDSCHRPFALAHDRCA
jgi:hypothetical protein